MQRCLFCKQPSENSKAIEHIIPESLGNKEHILPKGVVCDDCNSYFGSKVEKELLEQSFFVHLRHRQLVPTKKGKGVGWKMYSLFPVQNPERYLKKPAMPKDQMMKEMFQQGNLFYSPFIERTVPDNTIISRFLGKVAIEAMAKRVIDNPAFLNEIIDNDALDPLREYARYGKGPYWPYHERRIYDEDRVWPDEGREDYQLMHEYNILSFIEHEYYLVLAIFGIEFTINFANRNVDSFLAWVNNNDQKSPLFFEQFPQLY